jgi:hypothetical protein
LAIDISAHELAIASDFSVIIRVSIAERAKSSAVESRSLLIGQLVHLLLGVPAGA